MIRGIALAFALAVALVAQDQEAYPGQRNHEKPPAGWFCSPQRPDLSVPPDHVCECSRIAQRDETGACLHNQDGTEYVVEDMKCTVFCHKDHCRCPIDHCGS